MGLELTHPRGHHVPLTRVRSDRLSPLQARKQHEEAEAAAEKHLEALKAVAA